MKSIYTFLVKGYGLNEIFPYAKRWSFKWMWYHIAYVGFRHTSNAVIIMLSFVGFAYGWMTYGKASVLPQTVFATNTVTIEVESSSTPPVLTRIMECESHGHQFNASGQVLVNVNGDKSYDIGKYQINSVWNVQASKLGLDLTREKDNETMAKWIYSNRGTGDWYSSQECWSK